jgi:hypothetical protein
LWLLFVFVELSDSIRKRALALFHFEEKICGLGKE